MGRVWGIELLFPYTTSWLAGRSPFYHHRARSRSSKLGHFTGLLGRSVGRSLLREAWQPSQRSDLSPEDDGSRHVVEVQQRDVYRSRISSKGGCSAEFGRFWRSRAKTICSAPICASIPSISPTLHENELVLEPIDRSLVARVVQHCRSACRRTALNENPLGTLHPRDLACIIAATATTNSFTMYFVPCAIAGIQP